MSQPPTQDQPMPIPTSMPQEVVVDFPDAEQVQRWPNFPFSYYPRGSAVDYYNSPMVAPDQTDFTPEQSLPPPAISPAVPEEMRPQTIPQSIGSASPEHQDFLQPGPYRHHYRDPFTLEPGREDDEEMIVGSPPNSERSNSTSGQKRRAQNRVAQRAFRERKQQHVKDLEQQLTELRAKYDKLETEHNQLVTSHDRLKKVISFITDEQLSEKVQAVREVLDVLEDGQRLAKPD